jgi:hypothetical protein
MPSAVLKSGQGFKVVGMVVERIIVDMVDFMARRYFAMHSLIHHAMKED